MSSLVTNSEGHGCYDEALVSFHFRVSSCIVIAAHRRLDVLCWGGGEACPGESPFRHWPFSSWSINTLIPLVPVVRTGPVPRDQSK